MTRNGRSAPIEIRSGVDMTARLTGGKRRRPSQRPGGKPIWRLDTDNHLIAPDGTKSFHPVRPETAERLRAEAHQKNWRKYALAHAVEWAARRNYSKADTDWLITTYTKCIDASRTLGEAHRRLRLAGAAYDARVKAHRQKAALALANARLRLQEFEDDLGS